MAQFSVKTNQTRQQADAENNLISELKQIEDSINHAGNNLSFKIGSKYNIKSRLRSAANRVNAHQGGMSRLHSSLVGVIDSYERAEQRAVGNVGNADNASIRNIANGNWTSGNNSLKNMSDYVKGIIRWLHTGEMPEGIMNRLEEVHGFLKKAYESGFLGLNTIIPLSQVAIGTLQDIEARIGEIKDSVYDNTSFKADAKVNGALYSTSLECENGSLGVSVGAYEAYASAEGGLFEKDKDGNLVFNPNISAKAGASFTALELAGEYAVGDDFFGASASGNVTAGKVSGEVSGSAALKDKDGNFNPHAEVHASAEAILVDAKAQAGVTVLGTEAKVEGSVNIGVGAHANVEIGDGKIVCDIGASLGIGASISFSIDYGGTVKAMQSAAKSVWDKIKFW